MTSGGETAREAAIRDVLADVARRRETILYRDLARRAGVDGPQTLHKTVMALEAILRRDHAAGRPLLAAVAIGKTGLPRPGFFQCVRALGVYDGPDDGPAAAAWHGDMLAGVHAAWAGEDGDGTA